MTDTRRVQTSDRHTGLRRLSKGRPGSPLRTGNNPSAELLRCSKAGRGEEGLEGLQFLWLEITAGCNLRCQHCYTESSPSSKNPDVVDWKEVLREAYDLGCRQVQFIGGEPTYERRLLEYIEAASTLGYPSIEVFTNLTLLPDRLCGQFRKYRVRIATSFYSARKATHDRITGVAGSFERTVDGIRRVLAKKIPLRVGIIAMETNEHEIHEAAEFLVRLGVQRKKIGIDHTRPVGRGVNLAKRQCLEETLCGHCWEGKLAVSWNGTCYPCVFARQVVLGNVTRGGVAEIVRSERLRQFRQRIFDYSASSMKTGESDVFRRVLGVLGGGGAQVGMLRGSR